MPHDLVITGGTVVDGTGNAPFVADIAIEERVKQWGREIGFDAVAIAGTDLAEDAPRRHNASTPMGSR